MDTDDIPALDSIDAVIGARLRHERDRRHLSRADVAAATGLAAKTISRLEGGQRSASIQQLEAITAVYGMSVHTFMTNALKGTRFAARANEARAKSPSG